MKPVSPHWLKMQVVFLAVEKGKEKLAHLKKNEKKKKGNYGFYFGFIQYPQTLKIAEGA